VYQNLYTAREELFDSCRFHAHPHFPYEGTWLHQPIPGQTNRDGITQREPPDSASLHPGYLFGSGSAGHVGHASLCPTYKTLKPSSSRQVGRKSGFIAPSAECLHPADNAGKKTPAHPPYAGCST